MPPLRLRTTTVLALTAHGLVALSLLAMRTAPRTATLLTEEFPLEIEPLPAAPVPEHVAAIEEPRGAAASAVTAPARAVAAAPSAEIASAEPAASVVAPAGSAWTFDPFRQGAVDLSLGPGRRALAVGSVSAPAVSARQAPDHDPAKAVERSMRAELAARDVAMGLGRAGPLVTAAHEAATRDAPEVGVVILEIECDASGTVVAARADDKAWAPVAASVVRAMAGKAIRIPPGARGLRARVRVVAERSLPAGTRGTTSPGAVPDDVPGGGRACVGEGITRKCNAGMPAGVSGTAGDLSNIGAKLARIVHVQLLGETPL